ncbi:MAG: DUF2071 domain-containing protein [Planctomycetota bacterium]
MLSSWVAERLIAKRFLDGYKLSVSAEQEHRGAEATSGTGILKMQWADLLFLHWKVPAEILSSRLPPGLELDLFDGDAYIGVVPFEMRGVRFRFLPPMPTAHRFPEINLRTYVRSGERTGVWFFSLDASSRLTVRGARSTFSLPYFDARMSYAATPDGWTTFRSERTHKGVLPAQFIGRYRPEGDAFTSTPGSLDAFLTERYSLFAQADHGVPRARIGGLIGGALRRPLLCGDIQHVPWPLQRAVVEIERCDMFRLIGLEEPPPGEPLAHFARHVDVTASAPRAVK